MPKSANVSTRRATSVLLCAFFVTGATSLIFEVVWVRLLLLALGTTPVAMGVVLSAFMGGMAVGSWLAGRAVVRRLSPIAVYAGLEAWIGVWALATPLVLRLVDLAPPAGQLALGVLALLPATVAMGTSLPVLVRALDGSSTVRATTVGWLYAANTAGGVAGPLLAVFLLFPLAGLRSWSPQWSPDPRGFCGHRRRRENAPGGVHGHTEATTVTEAFKQEAVRLCLRHDRWAGGSGVDLTESAVRNWVKQSLMAPIRVSRRAFREVRVLREEREILKKAAAVFAT